MSDEALWTAAEDPHAREARQVRAALRGDAGAFREIVEEHHRGLLALATRLVRDRSEAQDLVQESLVKAFTHLDRFDATYRLSTWLHRITLNTCRDHLKSARRRERPTDDPAGHRADERPMADELIARRERARYVRDAIDALKPSYREILVLKDLEGLTYDQIHALTDTPVTALKIRVIRARQKLKERLDEGAWER